MPADDDLLRWALPIAEHILGIAHDRKLGARARRLDDVDGYYFWQPFRGGASLIVGRDGTFLYANSAVSLDQHKDAFTAGRRTDPAEFAAAVNTSSSAV